MPADRRKKFAEFRRAGYHCEAMCVVPDEMERIERANKRVAATGRVRLRLLSITKKCIANTGGDVEEDESELYYSN